MELFKANNQWSTRPADERFWTLEEMHNACETYKGQARVLSVPYSDIRVEAVDSDVQVTGKAGTPAKLTHWAFGQLARKVEAPANYLRNLPATLAVQNLNHGLKERSSQNNDVASLMFHKNGSLLLRSFLSEDYTRIWNSDITQRLMTLTADGWRVPPARPAQDGQPGTRKATEKDVLDVRMGGLGIEVGDLIAPAGLYASDHDMFAFLVNEKNRIEDGSDGGLSRGFFVSNSEVGAASFKLTTFLYRTVCANHIVWGAESVKEVSIRHIGRAEDKAWGSLAVEVKKYADSSVSDLEAQIKTAKSYQLGMNKDEVLDRLFGLKIAGRKVLDAAYEIAVENEKTDGAPNTAWGMMNGMTRLSQTLTYADERNEMDKAGAKILEVAF